MMNIRPSINLSDARSRTEAQGASDLLRFHSVRAVFTSKHFPFLPRLVSTAVFLLVLVYSFFGSPHGDNNLGIAVTWSIWWSLLPLSTVALGRIWCSFCPIAFLSDSLLRLQARSPSRDRFPTAYAVWVAGLLLLGLSWAAVVWRIEGLPQATGATLLLLLVGALGSGILFGRRSWCRSLCPIGVLTGLYAMVAAVELRVSDDACDRGCGAAKNLCPASRRSQSCLLHQPLPLAESNFDCHLCGDCVKACRHKSPRLRLRVPGQEIWHLKAPSAGKAAVVLMIVGVVLLDLIRMTSLYPAYMKRIIESGLFRDYHVAFSAVFLALIFGVLGVYLVTAWLSGLAGSEGLVRNFARFGYSYLLVIVAAHFGSVLFHTLVQGTRPLLAIGRELGLPIVLPAVVRGSIYVVNEPMQAAQLVLLALGTFGAAYSIWRLANCGVKERRLAVAAPHLALVLALAIGLGYLLSSPMGTLH